MELPLWMALSLRAKLYGRCLREGVCVRLDEDLKFRVAVVRTRYAGWELRAMVRLWVFAWWGCEAGPRAAQ